MPNPYDLAAERTGLPEIDTEHQRYFCALAGTELHAITFGLMALTQGPLSTTDLHKLFMQAQGPNPAWDLTASTNFGYARNVFTPAGLTEIGYETRKLFNRREPVDVRVATVAGSKEDVDYSLALCGVLFEWGLENPHTAQRQLFGQSDGVQRGAVNRLKILELLLTSPGLSEVETVDITGIPKASVNQYLLAMRGDDILVREAAYDWDNRTFKVVDQGFRHLIFGLEDMSLETQAVYDTIDRLLEKGREEVTAADLFTAVVQNHSNLDIDKLHYIISQALAVRERKDGSIHKRVPVLQSAGAFNQGRNTRYSVNPLLEESLKQLFPKLYQLQTDNRQAIDAYTAVAKEVLVDSTKVNTLVTKAKQASPHASGIEGQPILEPIREIIAREGAVSVRALSKLLKEWGIVMSSGHIDKRLEQMADEGLVTLEDRARNQRTTATAKFITAVAASH